MPSEYLDKRQLRHTVCVATDYGEEVMEHTEYVQIRQGRLDVPEMEALMRSGDYAVVVDATHPYATAVSENVRMACKAVDMPYLRYLRDAGRVAGSKTSDAHQSTSISGRDAGTDSSITWVNSAAEAATYLETQSGNIFLTTGSKELHVFTERISDLGRLFIRVLPSASVITECRNLGMEGKQICAMQGPFSAEMNIAMLKQTDAAFLVTKDTGTTGGYPEKEQAAHQLGVRMVVIRRPEEVGIWTLRHCLKSSGKHWDVSLKARKPKQVKKESFPASASVWEILGTLTHDAAEAIKSAQDHFRRRSAFEECAGDGHSVIRPAACDRVYRHEDPCISGSASTVPAYCGSDVRRCRILQRRARHSGGVRRRKCAFLLWNLISRLFCFEDSDLLAGCKAARVRTASRPIF